METLCDICGLSFVPVRPWQKRHAGECHLASERLRRAAGRADGRHLNPYVSKGPWRGVRVCRYCGESFEAKSTRSEVCYAVVCQNAKHAERTAPYVLARYARTRGASDAEVFSKRTVYERDGWVCGLCGEPIDPALSYPDPASASLDHIVPVTHGGPHTLANTQAAHLLCNSRKGSRA